MKVLNIDKELEKFGLTIMPPHTEEDGWGLYGKNGIIAYVTNRHDVTAIITLLNYVKEQNES